MTDVYGGIRILDFTQLEQGPSGTQVLADFGADVIKIERIGLGEIGRDHHPQRNGISPHWAANNRNKRSLSLDLKHPGSREVLHRLVQSADIVASNFRPGVMERLGLGHEELSAVNPRIISALASGYGQTGPYRHRRGQDLAAQAMGGLMALTGSSTTGPTAVGTYIVDYLGAMHFAQGMMLALAARERTGRGQVVDSCLLNSAVAAHLQEASTFLSLGRPYPRPADGIAHAHTSALYGQYICRDGEALVLIGEVFVDEPWQRVCRALDLPADVREDPRLQTVDGLIEHGEETAELLRETLKGLGRDEAMEKFEAEDLLVAPVNDYEAVFRDPQVIHNEMAISLGRPEFEDLRAVGMPVKLSATPGTVRLVPPLLGEHNDEVLRELGYDEEAVARLRAEGAVGAEHAPANAVTAG